MAHDPDPGRPDGRGPDAALTDADRDALLPYLETDLSVAEIARDLEWHRARVYRAADKWGFDVRGRFRSPTRHIEAAVEEMRPLQAVEYLIEAYYNLSGERPDRELQLVTDYRMHPAEAKVYAVLEARAGQVVTHETLATVFEQAGYEGVDLRGRIKVSICLIRQRIAQLGLRVAIETVWGVGYRLSRQGPSA